MPKVSVIVPVYGVEKYIERCARSLFEQTLDDMEFIFVDDCTKDESIEVLKRVIDLYPVRKDQVKIIHHAVNKGLSRARETGVNAATGDYIGHCDSDDWVEKEMYEEMYNLAHNEGHDYIKCGHRITDEKNTIEILHAFCEKNMTAEKVRRYIMKFNGWNSIWDTLVSRSIYLMARPRFTDFAMLEDFYLSSQLLLHVRSAAYIRKPFYNYYKNPDSICGSLSLDSVVNKTLQAQRNVDDIIEMTSNLQNRYTKHELIHIKWIVKNILIPVMDSPIAKRYWRIIYPEIKWEVLFDGSISWHNKARFYAAEFNLYKYFKIK